MLVLMLILCCPVSVDNSCVEIADEFQYLGSFITRDAKELSVWVARAAKAFRCLCLV